MRRYRAIDLSLFALIVCLLEAAAQLAIRLYPTEAFSFSAVLPIALIVMMRWGAWGILHAMLGGLVYSLLNGGGTAAVLAYTLGSALVGGNLVWFRLLGKKRVQQSGALCVLYTLSGYALMETGRAAVAAAFTHSPFFGLWVRYMSVDALSCVMAVIVILIARRRDKNGCVFQDQREYLAELAAREEQKPCA
ncbi:MAG: hypothetical protein Q4E65_01895 [Clostridia bacterium]|nr:hypothetical protein [Clostridia bacterium]